MNADWIPWFLVLMAGINTCIANLMVKQSRLVAPDSSLASLLLSPWLIGGLVFLGINVVLYGKALDRLPVSVAYPVLTGFGFGLLTIFSYWFFGERLAINQWFGVVFIFAGIILISRS